MTIEILRKIPYHVYTQKERQVTTNSRLSTIKRNHYQKPDAIALDH